jgi:hypothetical protein
VGGQVGWQTNRHILGYVRFGRYREIEGRDRDTKRHRNRKTELTIKIPSKAG